MWAYLPLKHKKHSFHGSHEAECIAVLKKTAVKRRQGRQLVSLSFPAYPLHLGLLHLFMPVLYTTDIKSMPSIENELGVCR